MFGWAGMNERIRNWLVGYLEGVFERERATAQAGLVGVSSSKEKMIEVKDEMIEVKEKVEQSLGGLSATTTTATTSAGEKTTERIRGWILMDYVDSPSDLLPMLVECNYH